jgi:hypothetical protein
MVVYKLHEIVITPPTPLPEIPTEAMLLDSTPGSILLKGSISLVCPAELHVM